jgi:predicted AlkP superfamily phosphohydrolase/phosphomutase
MAHWYGAHFLLGEILQRLGVTMAPPEPQPGAYDRVRSGLRGAWRSLPGSVRKSVRAVRDRVWPVPESGDDLPSLRADPARSRCFVVGNGLAVSGIRLNLAGREPLGTLRPGPDADAFCARLAADLLAIVDERTGRPLVAAVRRTAELYEGGALDRLPDLLVEWSDEVATGSTAHAGGAGARVRARLPNGDVVEGTNDYGRTGDHRPDGWLVAAGPGITPGMALPPVSLLDLAPTFAAMAGVTLHGVDGTAIRELTGEA